MRQGEERENEGRRKRRREKVERISRQEGKDVEKVTKVRALSQKPIALTVSAVSINNSIDYYLMPVLG